MSTAYDLHALAFGNQGFVSVVQSDATDGVQTTVMRISYADHDIGVERHPAHTQVLIGVSGVGVVHLWPKTQDEVPPGTVITEYKRVTVPLRPSTMVVVPRGVYHNVINVDEDAQSDLLLVSTYYGTPLPRAENHFQLSKTP